MGVAAAAILVACGSEGAAVVGESEAPRRVERFEPRDLDVIELEAELLSADPAIGQPTQMQLSGDNLWVSDMAADPGLHLLDAGTGRLVYSAGRTGQGPGEFMPSPFGLEVVPGDQSGGVWAWDLRSQRLARFEARPFNEFDVITVTLDGSTSITRVAWVGVDRIIGVAASVEARFTLFSATGERERVVAGQLLGADEIPAELRLRAMERISVRTWPGHGFVIAYLDAGRIEYYDSGAKFVRLAAVPDPSEPVFEKTATGEFNLDRETLFYGDCAATARLLFALFSGRRRSEYDSAGQQSGEYIHVFDWEGHLEAVYHLDRPVRPIVVDSSATFLYAGSLVDSRIYRYRLPIPPGE